VAQYPCIGGFRFISFQICQHPFYHKILERLIAREKLLDLGCGLGQEIRKLIADGAPANLIWGADLHPQFIELGYELFLDRNNLTSHFLAPADVFDESETSPLKEIEGEIDIIYIGSFLHIWDYDRQVQACKRIAKILSPKNGALVVGRQVGFAQPEKNHGSDITFVHNEETFKQMWKEVPGNWKVEVEVREIPKFPVEDSEKEVPVMQEYVLLMFTIERVV
jgi:SAM-dependent methyltransferase